MIMLNKTNSKITKPAIISALIHALVLVLLMTPNILPDFFSFNDAEDSDENKIIQVIAVPPDLEYKDEEPPDTNDTKNYSDINRKVDEEIYAKTTKESVAEAPSSKKAKKPLKDKIGLKKQDKTNKTAKLFPSDERIGEILKDISVQSPKEESGKILSLNTSELKYYKYLSDMKRRIEFFWEYPASSIRRGEQGYINIDFTIAKDGKIKDIKVMQSSNYPALDDAAISAIRLANPFNKFPSNFSVEDINVKGRFKYTLVGRGGGGRKTRR